MQEGWVWLTISAALTSVVSLFYYLRVIVFMYMKPASPPKEQEAPVPVISMLAVTGLLGTAAGIIYLGVFPNDFFQLAQLSVMGIAY